MRDEPDNTYRVGKERKATWLEAVIWMAAIRLIVGRPSNMQEQSRVITTGRETATAGIHPTDQRLDKTYVERLNRASDDRRKSLRSQVIAMFVLATFASLILELALNLKKFPQEGLFANGIHFATIGTADATVIVAGLLTVVAALNIALAGWRDSPTQVEPEDFAAGLIWADQLEYVTRLAAVLALATALLRVPDLTEEDLPLTLFLLGLGAASIMLSAAVFEWKSHKLPRRLREEAGIAVLQGHITTWKKQLNDNIWSPRKAYVRGVGFIAIIGAVGAVFVVVIALNGGGHIDNIWSLISGLAGFLVIIEFYMPILVWLTIKSWVAARQRPEDRDMFRVARWLYVIFMTLSYLAIAANIPVVPAVLWVIIGAIGFFGLVLPMVLMFVAKVWGVGPARFALHLRIAAGERTVSKMRDSLTEVD